MNLDELEKRVLNPLKAHINDIDPLHIKVAYEDMMNIAAVALQFEQEGNINRLIEILEEGNKDEANLVYWKNRCSYSLLKAVYTFADVFINVALREIHNRSRKDWPLDQFCKLISPLGMDEEIVRDTWCIKKYRNVIVIHWSINRMHAYHGDASGEHRLSPIPKGFNVDNEDSIKINSMYEKYKPLYPDLTNSPNYFERLRGLYYRIPLGEANKVNPDRKKIDRIAEKGGCDSMTIREIGKIMQSFITELSNAVIRCRGNFA